MQTKNPQPKVLDDDAKFEWAQKKAKKKYKNQVRKYRREAETEMGELNLIAMMDMMTILLVFLIKSYGAADISVAMGDDLMPPTSSAILAPVPSITLTVTKKDIAVGEKGVVNLMKDEKGEPRVPADKLQGLLIVPVKEALDKEVEKNRNILANNAAARARADKDPDKDPSKMLTIIGDKDMSYEMLFSILGTAGQAELKYFKFLVISSNG